LAGLVMILSVDRSATNLKTALPFPYGFCIAFSSIEHQAPRRGW